MEENDMQNYLFIGGNQDGIDIPLASATDTIQLPVNVTRLETYVRETLIIGAASVVIYRHESLTPEQVLDRLVEHYKAWRVNMPGGRR
jgi:hypothetical protein